MKKAQTQVVTLVLISGVIISLMGFAYAWGVPLVEKRSVITQFTSAIHFMEDLDRKIVDMAGACSFEGACEESLDLPVPGLIRLNESINTIIYEFQANQPLITEGEVLFNTVDNASVARYGETPGVISLKGKKLAVGSYTLRFYLRYRELDSDEPFRGYIIQLVKSETVSGNSKIGISYDGSETIEGGADNGGNLLISRIKVQPM
ncbi:MAG: hypothetical protein V3U72_01045 [Candidatus Aenigmarchaeota archaeon]